MPPVIQIHAASVLSEEDFEAAKQSSNRRYQADTIRSTKPSRRQKVLEPVRFGKEIPLQLTASQVPPPPSREKHANLSRLSTSSSAARTLDPKTHTLPEQLVLENQRPPPFIPPTGPPHKTTKPPTTHTALPQTAHGTTSHLQPPAHVVRPQGPEGSERKASAAEMRWGGYICALAAAGAGVMDGCRRDVGTGWHREGKGREVKGREGMHRRDELQVRRGEALIFEKGQLHGMV